MFPSRHFNRLICHCTLLSMSRPPSSAACVCALRRQRRRIVYLHWAVDRLLKLHFISPPPTLRRI